MGLGVEPSSATSYAAWKKLLQSGSITEKETAVLIATGHALKDPGFLNYLESKTVSISEYTELDAFIHKLV